MAGIARLRGPVICSVERPLPGSVRTTASSRLLLPLRVGSTSPAGPDAAVQRRWSLSRGLPPRATAVTGFGSPRRWRRTSSSEVEQPFAKKRCGGLLSAAAATPQRSSSDSSQSEAVVASGISTDSSWPTAAVPYVRRKRVLEESGSCNEGQLTGLVANSRNRPGADVQATWGMKLPDPLAWLPSKRAAHEGWRPLLFCSPAGPGRDLRPRSTLRAVARTWNFRGPGPPPSR